MVSRPLCLGVNHPSGAYDQNFIAVRQLWVCCCGALSLTREQIYRLQLLLGLASAVILGSESPGESWPYLVPRFRDSPNLEGQVTVFIYPRNRVVQLYPRHWVPFSSPTTTRRATVEVFEPTSMRGNSPPAGNLGIRLYPCNRPWGPVGLWDVEVPIFSLDTRLTDGVRLSALIADRPLPPGRFLVLISVRG
jgi:hypothetical protein